MKSINLISPTRTEGNRRLFSFNDIDKLLEIKDLLDQGVNMAGIKQVLQMKENQTEAVESKQKKRKKFQKSELTQNSSR